MEEIGKKVDKGVSAEAAQGHNAEGQVNPKEEVDRIVGLSQNFPWWTPKATENKKDGALPY